MFTWTCDQTMNFNLISRMKYQQYRYKTKSHHLLYSNRSCCSIKPTFNRKVNRRSSNSISFVKRKLLIQLNILINYQFYNRSHSKFSFHGINKVCLDQTQAWNDNKDYILFLSIQWYISHIHFIEDANWFETQFSSAKKTHFFDFKSSCYVYRNLFTSMMTWTIEGNKTFNLH